MNCSEGRIVKKKNISGFPYDKFSIFKARCIEAKDTIVFKAISLRRKFINLATYNESRNRDCVVMQCHIATSSNKGNDCRWQQTTGRRCYRHFAGKRFLGKTGSDGSFILQENPGKYRLIIQHLLYATRQVECRGQNVDTIFLEPKDFVLGEVLVKNKPSFVKVENGRLEYDLVHLFEGRVVNNVYEALARLPGIREDKDGLSLIGAGRTTVVIDGKPKNMDEEQFETFLRSMPVERVEKVEVMYSAPPEYHTRGAVVNVILEKSPEHSFQGEVNADYRNRYFNGGGIDANFRLAMSKITFDLMYGAENVKNLEYIDLYSEHSFDGRIYDIQQNERLSSKFWNHNLGALMTYNVDAKSY